MPPLNLAGDFGGGSMFLLVSILSALFERQTSGKGQVVDAAMVDGSSVLMQMMWGFRRQGMWSDERGTNVLDTGAPYYDTYETADGQEYAAVGSIEAAVLRRAAGQAGTRPGGPARPERRRPLADCARSSPLPSRRSPGPLDQGVHRLGRVRQPVLSFAEVETEPHIAERDTFFRFSPDDGDNLEPMPAPRFSRSVPSVPTPPRVPGSDTESVLRDAGPEAPHRFP